MPTQTPACKRKCSGKKENEERDSISRYMYISKREREKPRRTHCTLYYVDELASLHCFLFFFVSVLVKLTNNNNNIEATALICADVCVPKTVEDRTGALYAKNKRNQVSHT